MSTYVAYMGTNDFIGGDIDVESITVNHLKAGEIAAGTIIADELEVVGDIKVGGLVDDVDINALGQTVAEHSGTLVNHENRIHSLETGGGGGGGGGGDFVDLSSDQPHIYGKKGWLGEASFVKDVAMFENLDVYGFTDLKALRCESITQTNGALVNGFNSLLRLYNNLDMQFGGDIIMGEGKTVDGVDVSALGERVAAIEDPAGRYVTTDTSQTIRGRKRFDDSIFIDNGDCNAGRYRAKVTMGGSLFGQPTLHAGLDLNGDDGCGIRFNGFMDHYFHDPALQFYEINRGTDNLLSVYRGAAFAEEKQRMLTFDGAANEIVLDSSMRAQNGVKFGEIDNTLLNYYREDSFNISWNSFTPGSQSVNCKEAAEDVMEEVDDLERCELRYGPAIPKKFIFLRERKFKDAEWSLVEKHGLRVYEFDATSIGKKTLDNLLLDYDVIVIDIQGEDGRRFWQQWHYTFPREGICVASVCDATPAKEFLCSYKIESVVKTFSDFGGDKEAFCRSLAGGSLKKPLPWYKRLLRRVLRFFVGVQN